MSVGEKVEDKKDFEKIFKNGKYYDIWPNNWNPWSSCTFNINIKPGSKTYTLKVAYIYKESIT